MKESPSEESENSVVMVSHWLGLAQLVPGQGDTLPSSRWRRKYRLLPILLGMQDTALPVRVAIEESGRALELPFLVSWFHVK